MLIFHTSVKYAGVSIQHLLSLGYWRPAETLSICNWVLYWINQQFIFFSKIMSSPLTWIYINNLCQITCQGKKLTIWNYYSITLVPVCHSLHKDNYNTYFQWYRTKLQAPLTTMGFLLILFPCSERRMKIHFIHRFLRLGEGHGVFREVILRIKELAQQ